MHGQKTEEQYSKEMEKALLCLIVLAMAGSYFIQDLLRIMYFLAMALFLFRSFQDQRRNDMKRMYITS